MNKSVILKRILMILWLPFVAVAGALVGIIYGYVYWFDEWNDQYFGHPSSTIKTNQNQEG